MVTIIDLTWQYLCYTFYRAKSIHTHRHKKRSTHKGKVAKNSPQVSVKCSCGLPWYSQWVKVEPQGVGVSAQALSAFGAGPLSVINLRVCEL